MYGGIEPGVAMVEHQKNMVRQRLRYNGLTKLNRTPLNSLWRFVKLWIQRRWK